MSNQQSNRVNRSFPHIRRGDTVIALSKFWWVVRTDLRLAYRERLFLLALPVVLALDLAVLPQLLPYVKTFTAIATQSTRLLRFVLVFYAIFPPVESIIRDVSSNREEILFPGPIPTGSYLLAKFTSNVLHVSGIILLLLFTNLVYGLAVSAHAFALLPFFSQYFLIVFPVCLFMMALAFAIAAITKNRYVPYLCCISFFIVSDYFLPKIDQLANYIWLIDWWPRDNAYSSMNGFGAYLDPIVLNRIFYAGLTLLLLFISIIMFNREGRDGFLTQRIPRTNGAALAGLILFTTFMGIKIYRQTPRYYDPEAKARRKALSDSLRSLPGLSAKHYNLKIDLYPANHRIDVEAEIRIRNENSRPVAEAVLTLNPFAEIRSIKIDDNSTPFRRAFELIRIEAEPSIPPGKEAEIEVGYKAWFPARLARGRLNSCITRTYSYLLTEDYWFPLVGFPRDFSTQLFTADVEIGIADEKSIALSNGRLLNVRTENGRRYFHWRVENPTFALALVSGRYEKIEKGPIQFYLANFENPNAEKVLQSIKRIISVLENHFGKLPYPKIAIVEIPESRHGGHGDPSLISISEGLFLQNAEDYSLVSILAHEIAHQWWPDVVPCKQKGIGFLSEGLAEFSSLLVIEALQDRVERRYKLARWRYTYLTRREVDYEKSIAETSHPIQENDPRIAANYSAISYAKSPYVLHMLRYVMGEEAFFKALNDYIGEYEFRGANIDDFVSVFNAADSDLSWFFDEWIYGKCLPDYTFEKVEVREVNERFAMHGKIKNLGTGKMPVIVQARGAGRQVRKTLWIGSEQSLSFTLQTDFRPEQLEIDPDREILQWNTRNDVWKIEIKGD